MLSPASQVLDMALSADDYPGKTIPPPAPKSKRIFN
jgi:hypothetical protein